MKEKNVPSQLNLVTSEDISKIHEVTLDVLAEKGASFKDPEAIDLLLSAGAIREKNDRIKIPKTLVEKAIDSAPSVIKIFNRDGKETMRLEQGNKYCGTGSDCPYMIDSKTGERRLTLKKDIEIFTRLSDALPNIDFILSMAMASDVPTHTADLHHFQAMIKNTTKPIFFTVVNSNNMQYIVDIAYRIAGGPQIFKERPFIVHFAMPSPPLSHSKTALQNIIYCARNNVPVVYGSGTQMGTSGPMTIAGSAVSANCDILAGLVVHQLSNPGAPFIYGIGLDPLDMQTMIDSYGAPEHFSGDIIHAQVAQRYNLPIWGFAACTDSKILDLQAAIEFMGSTLFGMLSNCHLLHDVGYLESGMTASCESILLGNEVIEIVRNMLKPIIVNEETIPVDLLKKVGPNQSFLVEKHTLKHYRDFFYSSLIDRKRYGKWIKDGALSMFDRLKLKVKDILSSHNPVPLDKLIIESIDKLITEKDKKTISQKR